MNAFEAYLDARRTISRCQHNWNTAAWGYTTLTIKAPNQDPREPPGFEANIAVVGRKQTRECIRCGLIQRRQTHLASDDIPWTDDFRG